MPLSRGDVVAGRYEVEELLEESSGIELYRARHLLSGRKSWLKLITEGESFAEALLERATQIVGLEATGLCACIDSGRASKERLFFAYNLEPGSSFAELEEPLDRERVLAAGRDLATGLAALHDAGFVHGHVRPDQIILCDKHGGAARLRDGLLAPSRMIAGGSAAFVAPEVVAGAEPNAKSDIYGLAMSLLAALGSSTTASSQSRLATLLGTLFGLRPELPPELSQVEIVFRAMLARDPEDRPDGHRVATALARMLQIPASPSSICPPRAGLEPEARKGTALSVLVIRSSGGKAHEALGLDAAWRHAVSAHGARVLQLLDGTLLCVLEKGKPGAIPTAAAFVAKTTQEMAFRAGAVAGLLLDGSEGDPRGAIEAEVLELAALAATTPAGVIRITTKLAERCRSSLALRASGEAFVLVAPASQSRQGLAGAEPKRRAKHGTLEMEGDFSSEPPNRTMEIELDSSGVEIDELQSDADDPYERPTREVELSEDDMSSDFDSVHETPTLEVPVDPGVLSALRNGP